MSRRKKNEKIRLVFVSELVKQRIWEIIVILRTMINAIPEGAFCEDNWEEIEFNLLGIPNEIAELIDHFYDDTLGMIHNYPEEVFPVAYKLGLFLEHDYDGYAEIVKNIEHPEVKRELDNVKFLFMQKLTVFVANELNLCLI